MIKLTSLISEIYISGFQSTNEQSKFRMPENFDKYGQGAGWYAYTGCNDWECGRTAAAVYFEGVHDKHRIWFSVKYPPHLTKALTEDSATPRSENPAYRWGQQATETWLREARKIHRVPKEYNWRNQPMYRSWSECFQLALTAEGMKQYVNEWGVDGTTWQAYRPSQN